MRFSESLLGALETDVGLSHGYADTVKARRASGSRTGAVAPEMLSSLS